MGGDNWPLIEACAIYASGSSVLLKNLLCVLLSSGLSSSSQSADSAFMAMPTVQEVECGRMKGSTELLVGNSRGKVLCVDMWIYCLMKHSKNTTPLPLHHKEKWSFRYLNDTCCLDDILSYLLKTNPVNFPPIGEELWSEKNHLYFSARTFPVRTQEQSPLFLLCGNLRCV